LFSLLDSAVSLLLQAADGKLDRLLARLQKLVGEGFWTDNFNLLCARVGQMVTVR